MNRKTVTRKIATRQSTATRQSSAPSHPRTEWMTLHTLEGAITEAIGTFGPDDAICSLGDAWCSLTDLSTWIAALPATQCAERRFGIGIGNITERSTGVLASHYVTLEMAPLHTAVSPDGDARIRRDKMTFLLAVQSLHFLRNAPGWNTMRQVHPVALDSDGLEFEDA